MSGVKNALNELKSKQEDLQAQLDERDVEIKKAQSENYEVAKRLINMQRNCEMTLRRAIQKEEYVEQSFYSSCVLFILYVIVPLPPVRATKLEEAFEAANSKVKNLSSKESEDSTLSDEVSELQKKLQEATRKAEISEREIAGVEQLIKTAGGECCLHFDYALRPRGDMCS
ncbi:unnamed protein product [Schistocephalus solidus]|uniref:Shootin-1 n=1 Tax=Schistocephalus solidus TaxID=70667 RepID=A0A183T0D4_SCHSO|nr:unnamed protein product [Schistocephalus solidus]